MYCFIAFTTREFGVIQELRLFSAALAALALVGCAHLSQLQSRAMVGREADPPVGSLIALAQTVAVPAGSIKGWFDLEFYAASPLSLSGLFYSNSKRNNLRCGVRLARPVPADGPSILIEPGIFSVERVVRESDPLGIDPSTISMFENYASDITLTYRIDLSSSKQPQVASFFCSQRHASLSRDAVYPSAVDLQQQAGEKLVWPR